MKCGKLTGLCVLFMLLAIGLQCDTDDETAPRGLRNRQMRERHARRHASNRKSLRRLSTASRQREQHHERLRKNKQRQRETTPAFETSFSPLQTTSVVDDINLSSKASAPTSIPATGIVSDTPKSTGNVTDNSTSENNNPPYGYQPAQHVDEESETGEMSVNESESDEEKRWTIIREKAKEFRIEILKNEILARLGLSQGRPNITQPPFPSGNFAPLLPGMWEKISKTEENEEQDDYYAKTYQCLLPSCDKPRACDKQWSELTTENLKLYFKVASNKENPKVKLSSASLRLYKRAVPAESSKIFDITQLVNVTTNTTIGGNTAEDNFQNVNGTDSTLTISVHQYLRPIRKNKRVKKELLHSINVSRHYEGWIKLNVEKAVEQWKRQPGRNFGLELTVIGTKDEILDPREWVDVNNCSDPHNFTLTPLPFPVPLGVDLDHGNKTYEPNITVPSLEITTIELAEDTVISRSKRGLKKEKKCEKEPHFVSFAKDLGMEKVIFPKVFLTHICKGTCTPSTGIEYFRNLIFQKEQKTRYCQPTQTKPLVVFYMTEDGLVAHEILNDFIVVECGC